MRVYFSAFGVSQPAASGRSGRQPVDLPDGATVAQLFEQLSLTWGEIGIIRVNDRLADEDEVLREGDDVAIFAPVGGGQDWPFPRTLPERLWLRGVARLKEWLSGWQRGQLNLSWVTGSLAVGGAFQPRDIPRLVAQGIGAIVDLREEAADDAAALRRWGVEWLHLPSRDGDAPTLEQLSRGVDWVATHLAEGKRVFIHCQHGVGRAPLLAAAVLVHHGQSPAAALAAIRSKRWQAAPNDRQLEALLQYARSCRAGVAAS